MMMPLVSLPNLSSITHNFPDGFKELLNSMHLDDVNDKIKNDDILQMIGCRYFKSLERKKTKYSKPLSMLELGYD